ncbi:hypothetical protein CHLNCDRAFT_141436 [Chlorella variabilis]|uniref:Calcineurin-like phosphoesterase domain-containing protein n=1 Tax=Chlorella variabilis TaxID=554065 RepID=E1ZSV5_CHLVA|nr:hypothetical protein CHLNCDRAFT_141436 [Chlorella variabilis]EFN51072.1 hypothetical protein CHLNCDRAFT_141436 [Chlorella variabilis]|eukprot:XP_005843174.1 hypothetical protein CHLNCDRAFT_141436 [Chlorella variabilis]
MIAGVAAQGSQADVQVALPQAFPVRFFVVGDWGRASDSHPNGYNQTRVAQMMTKKANSAYGKPHFVLSTGDNFYGFGLRNLSDPWFTQKFTNIYKGPGLQVPWFSVLGSEFELQCAPLSLKRTRTLLHHDYSETSYCTPDEITSPLYQLDPALRKRDWRWHAFRNRKLSLAGGQVDLFFWDTTPSSLYNFYICSGGFKGGIRTQSWPNNVVWLQNQLAASKASWKLIVAHHPPRSSGRHGGSSEVKYAVESLIRKYRAQVYFAGHDHDLEHLHYNSSSFYKPNYHTIVSGGGSRRYTEGFGYDDGVPSDYYPTDPSSVWGALTDGYVAVTLKAQEMVVQFYSTDFKNGTTAVHVARIPRLLKPGPDLD